MMDYRKRFAVIPGSKVQLARIDPGFTGENGNRERAATETREQVARMERLQYRLYADASQSLLVVLQGLDAAGKDGTIRHLFSGMNPQGVSVFAFKEPTEPELEHDFLWQVHRHAPGNGEVVSCTTARTTKTCWSQMGFYKLVARQVWSKRYDLINAFEQMLAENRTRILKFYLHISPGEQLARFKQQRLDYPARHWKISESDYSERALWPQYIEAYQDALAATSTSWAPWFVIPADHKWFRNLAISQIVADAMDDMGLKLPLLHVDLTEIRRKYHAAERQAL